MTYISRREKVFDIPEHETEASPPVPKRSDHRLKRFPSVNDRRAWTLEECQRYQHLYGLVSGSKTNVSKVAGFKYIPFDVLLTILMAEKDAYIQRLLEKQERSSDADVLYKADRYEDSDDDRDALIRKDAEVIALKNKISSLQSELEEHRNALRNSQCELENYADLISENSSLRKQLKKAQQGGKGEFELRLQSPVYGERGDCQILESKFTERDFLIKKIEELECKLKESREMYDKQLKEKTLENEMYKKKLDDMKCLEKQVEDLNLQAHNLTDKYKKASQKVNEHAKEIQSLSEERDRLQKRINELLGYESQFNALQKKLQQVELIINENETLNIKVMHLNKLEKENEKLKEMVEKLGLAEKEAAVGKERTLQLQKELRTQEEEIKNLFSQIDKLSKGYANHTELCSLKNELQEKNSKIMLYERQLNEIPMLEAEIEKLRGKLEKYENEFLAERDALKRLQSELNSCRNRCLDLEKTALAAPVELKAEGKNSESELLVLKAPEEENGSISPQASSCAIIELKEPRNLPSLSSDISITFSDDMKRVKQEEWDSLCKEIEDLKKIIDKKYCRIESLEEEKANLIEKLRECDGKLRDFEEKLENMEDVNKKLNFELDKASEKIRKFENLLETERRAKNFAENLTKQLEEKYKEELLAREKLENLTKLQKEEFNLYKRETLGGYLKEIDDLKREIIFYEKLVKELKEENFVLKEEFEYLEKDKLKKAEESLMIRLRNELDNLWNLPKSEMEKQCEALREKLKESEEELEELRISLEGERKLKEDLEGEVGKLQEVITNEKEILKNKEIILEELNKAKNDLVKSEGALKEENEKLLIESNRMQRENKCLQGDITQLLETVKNQEKEIGEQKIKINEKSEKIKDFEKLLEESRNVNEELSIKNEEYKNEKENEILNLKNEIDRLSSEIEVLKNRLEENKLKKIPKIDYARDLREKYAIEETLKKLETELNDLKGKSSDCHILMEELTILKENKNSLMIKVADFEAKIEMLKNNEGRCVLGALLTVCHIVQKSVSCPTSPTKPPVMSIEEHKKIMTEVENRFTDEISNMRNVYEEKIKSLIEMYQKEEKIKNRAYNDAINNIKNNYESDIKKLAEKHKASINRLQELHEDEVQELNTNYETQMEAMQTQNENIMDDLRRKEAEKWKQMTEVHNQEIKNLERKYQELMKERELEHSKELTNLKNNLAVNIDDIDGVHKMEIDRMREKYEASIAELEEKHMNEIKKIKKSNLKRMDTIKLKYDDLLAAEKKKCEEIVLDRLRRGQEGDQAGIDFQYDRRNSPVDLVNVLQKVINFGSDALTINERILIHCKTCKGIDMDHDGKSISEPTIGDTALNLNFLKAEREQLLKKVLNLENEIASKKMEAQESIANIEKAEKSKTLELRNALQTEIQKNAELKRMIAQQPKSLSLAKSEKNLPNKQENEIMEKMKELEKEKAEKKCLQELLKNEKNNVKQLTQMLEIEIEKFNEEKRRDAEYIESMKQRLDEAISHEQIIESQLDYEASTRAKLQSDLEALQRSLNLIVDSPPQETKTYKDIKNHDQSKSVKARSKSKSKTRRKT